MFGQRLKDERTRLGLTQPMLAEYVGSAKRTVVDWEQEKSSPTAKQLMAMQGMGVDTHYLLTGQRSVSIELHADEEMLLDSYRALPKDKKKVALQFFLGGLDGLNKDNTVVNGISNSPNAKISNSFNSQKGMTDIELAFIGAVCGIFAMVFGAMAEKFVDSYLLGSLMMAVIGFILLIFTSICMILSYTTTNLAPKNFCKKKIKPKNNFQLID